MQGDPLAPWYRCVLFDPKIDLWQLFQLSAYPCHNVQTPPDRWAHEACRHTECLAMELIHQETRNLNQPSVWSMACAINQHEGLGFVESESPSVFKGISRRNWNSEQCDSKNIQASVLTTTHWLLLKRNPSWVGASWAQFWSMNNFCQLNICTYTTKARVLTVLIQCYLHHHKTIPIPNFPHFCIIHNFVIEWIHNFAPRFWNY